MLRLSRLPRPLNAINVHYTTPGHANPYFLDRSSFIDPGHPATRLTLSKLPLFVSPHFTIRAFPHAVLREPVDFVPINPILATALVRARLNPRKPHKWWSNLHTPQCRVETNMSQKKGLKRLNNVNTMRKHVRFVTARRIMDVRIAALAHKGKHNLSLLFHTSKKNTSKSAVIRRRLRSKMSTAIALVISRSADGVELSATDCPATSPSSSHARHPVTLRPPLSLVYRPLSEGERFVLQGWTYLVMPELSIYKTPLPSLVQEVRNAFVNLGHQSIRLESSWSAPPKTKATKPAIGRRPPGTHSLPDRK